MFQNSPEANIHYEAGSLWIKQDQIKLIKGSIVTLQALLTLILVTSHCMTSPMFPLISLLQDGEMMEMGMEGAEAMAGAMDAADMTAMGEYIYMFAFKEKMDVK